MASASKYALSLRSVANLYSKVLNMSLQDLNLPKSIVQRLAKGVLPPNTQVQKDALLAMSKGATVFVNYITSQSVPPPILVCMHRLIVCF